MGVQGLHSFIESDGDFLKPRLFRGSKLIIDGSSLFFYIYFSSHVDQVHGGDYNAFEKMVKAFFRQLGICHIVPYVVMDGGDDPSGKKFNTLKMRLQERIKRANALSRGRSGQVLPIQAQNVFKQILRKLGVPFIQCLVEADWEVAALANEWNCPVLSNDSDFYIFGNKGGFLPISHFKWRKVNTLSGTTQHFIRAKWFGSKNLCSAYNNMNKALLPLFATILGNDYTKLDKGMFPTWTKFSSKLGAISKVDGLLVWLSRYRGPREAITALVSPMGQKPKSAATQRALNEGMSAYRLRPSSIAQFFLRGEPQSRPPGPLQDLPAWMLKPLAEGRLGSTVIDVLTMQRVMLNTQVEDFQLSSSSETSKLIRQVRYGLLLCTRTTGAGAHGTPPTEVQEYDRQELTLICNKVPAVLPRRVVTHLYLDTLGEAPRHLRLQVLLDALCVSAGPDSRRVPESLQLAVYVTSFWLKHAQPEPKAETFWALLIGFVYGELCRAHQENKEAAQVIKSLKTLQCRKGKRKILDLELAHAYSQWQRCLKDGYSLSQLLDHPVPEPELEWLFWGSLVHGVAHHLRAGIKPESFLAGAPFANELYKQLKAAVEEELDQDFALRIRTRSGPSMLQESQKHMGELSKRFQHLLREDESETDKDLTEKIDAAREEACSIRTRHKKKKRNRNTDTIKKPERVSWQ